MMSEYLNYWFSINGVSEIIEIFEKQKIDIRFVGGCIREAFLGNKKSDIDFAVNCNPDFSSNILKQKKIKFMEYGKEYGTITAIIGRKKFDITSLREDIEPSGRYTSVKFTDDWYKDASRRDFTFNAMNLKQSGELVDYFNGKQDISLQTVRFIGEIEKRIKEDYLRILRYYRFLGLFKEINLIKDYNKILEKNISHLRLHVSNDVIRNELLKTLKNQYKINSFSNLYNYQKPNILICTIKKWWEEDKYDLGLKKCMNTIDELFKN